MNKQELENNQHYIADDEIDLVQLFQILLKRKYLILGVVLFCLLGGGLYVFLKPTTYEYTTALQIGMNVVGNSSGVTRVEIEPLSSAKLKLETIYIPAAIEEMSSKHAGKFYKASAVEQKNSNIIIISSKGGKEDSSIYSNFHTLAVLPLIDAHGKSISVFRKQDELVVNKAKLRLNDLRDPQLFGLEEKIYQGNIEIAKQKTERLIEQKLQLIASRKDIVETRKIVSKQIIDIEENIELSRNRRIEAIAEVDSASNALTFLMLNGEIQENETRLAILKERLYVTLVEKDRKIEGQVSNNQRLQKQQNSQVEQAKIELTHFKAQRLSDQNQQQNSISSAENKINMYENTKALSLAIRSLSPVGTGKSLILALAGMLGLMGGIMLAFLAEFMTKVKQQERSSVDTFES